MRLLKPGEKKSALCHRDGRVTATFAYKDVPFRDGRGIAKNVLVGVCDVCGDAIVVPAQSTPAIAAARKRIDRSLEVNIPATFVDALDAAIVRVAANPTADFRKQLLVFYINRYAAGEESPGELAKLANRYASFFSVSTAPNKRLSMKLSEATDDRLEEIRARFDLSKTDLVKSLVMKIYGDIVEPAKPRHQRELSQIAEVLSA